MRRKQESFPELLLHFFRSVPWWIGPIVIAAIFIILRWAIPAAIEVPQIHADMSSPEKAMDFSHQVMGNGVALFCRWLAPWASLFVGVVWLCGMAVKYRGQRL